MRTLPDRDLRSEALAPATVTRTSASADQRRRILRATGELIAKRGYRAVTIDLICKRAKVSFSTFYKHFDNKEGCFLALFDGAVATVTRQIATERDHGFGFRPWPEQVIAALRVFVEAIAAEPLIARACIVETPTAGRAALSRYVAASRAFVPLFQGGRDYEPVSADLPETIEETLSGSVLWSARQQLALGDAAQIGDLLPELTRLVFRPYLGDAEAARLAGGVKEGVTSSPGR